MSSSSFVVNFNVCHKQNRRITPELGESYVGIIRLPALYEG